MTDRMIAKSKNLAVYEEVLVPFGPDITGSFSRADDPLAGSPQILECAPFGSFSSGYSSDDHFRFFVFADAFFAVFPVLFFSTGAAFSVFTAVLLFTAFSSLMTLSFKAALSFRFSIR